MRCAGAGSKGIQTRPGPSRFGKHDRLAGVGVIHQANHPLDEIIHKTEATGLTSIAIER